MDRAYEGDRARQLVLNPGSMPVVPPKTNRPNPWVYSRVMYRRRNEIKRIFSRFEKLDVMFLAFIPFAMIVEAFG